MYERFTDRARKVMQLANRESQRFNHEYIGTEHILLGLIGEGSGVATSVLKNFGIPLHSIRMEVEKYVQSGPDVVTIGKLPQTPRAKMVIGLAMEEARNLRHDCVGTEHILLGLLGDEEGFAAQLLMNLGLRLEKVRAEVENVLAQPNDWGRQPFSTLPRLRPIEERARKVVEIPTACPKCGDSHIVRMLWHNAFVSKQDLSDFNAGRAILGSISEIEGPSWVCLRCSPRWSEVHQLAMQDYELQAAKQEAVAATDFDTAARHRDTQVDLRRLLWQLVKELLKDQ